MKGNRPCPEHGPYSGPFCPHCSTDIEFDGEIPPEPKLSDEEKEELLKVLGLKKGCSNCDCPRCSDNNLDRTIDIREKKRLDISQLHLPKSEI